MELQEQQIDSAQQIQLLKQQVNELTQKLEALERSKTDFVSLVSHQLRTPLTTVNWYAEIMLAEQTGDLNVNQKKFLEEIYKANRRMVELVNALLNVSRLELGTFSVDPKMTDVVTLCKDVVQELEPDIFKRKLAVEEHYELTGQTIQVDPQLMRMIFQNLLSNAIKYTPEGGRVDFSIKLQQQPHAPEENLFVVVSDTGYGIPEHQQRYIFSKFFRADNAREKETNGTGLGLYIVKMIVDYAGGKIWFSSKEQRGTAFSILLPLGGMKQREGTKGLE